MISDDEHWYALVCRQFGRPVPKVQHRVLAAVTAAVISKPRLIVVTARLGGRSSASIDAARSRIFELQDRAAMAVRSLARDVESFFARTLINEVFLRSLPAGGGYAGHPFNYKIEAILQLLPELRLTFVDTNRVGAWVRREDPELPLAPDHGLGAYWEQKQDKAIETALFVAEHYDQDHCFWDGSDGHE